MNQWHLSFKLINMPCLCFMLDNLNNLQVGRALIWIIFHYHISIISFNVNLEITLKVCVLKSLSSKRNNAWLQYLFSIQFLLYISGWNCSSPSPLFVLQSRQIFVFYPKRHLTWYSELNCLITKNSYKAIFSLIDLV